VTVTVSVTICLCPAGFTLNFLYAGAVCNFAEVVCVLPLFF
jgi:hypothetical protein